MTMTAVGMTGTVDQVGDAQRWAIMGPRFRVAGAGDLALTASTTTNLTINVAAGTGMCCGVFATNSAAATVTLAANASGSTREDTIIMRFIWGNPGSVTFLALTGTSPTIPVVPTWTPGVQYDAVLGYVSVLNGVGLINSAQVIDQRLYGGIGGDFISQADVTNPSGLNAYIDLPYNSNVKYSNGARKVYLGYGVYMPSY